MAGGFAPASHEAVRLFWRVGEGPRRHGRHAFGPTTSHFERLNSTSLPRLLARSLADRLDGRYDNVHSQGVSSKSSRRPRALCVSIHKWSTRPPPRYG
jgi:hypothetical protein